MITRGLSYLSMLTIFLAIYGLFTIKDKVQGLNYQFNQVNKQIQEEQDKIYILKAELSYLSAPDRIRRLANKYLALGTIKIAQMIENPLYEKPMIQATLKTELNQRNTGKTNVKWRYKKGPSKYIQTVANRR